MRDANLEQLIIAARLLKPILGELVFVGGCVTGLLLTDEAAAEPRTTYDVDAIAEITSYAEYTTFAERLRELGFSEDSSENAPLCRWVQQGTILDVMPLDEKILGFSNRWYEAAMEESETISVESGLEIRTISAPYFIATKLEAFKGRGRGDFFGSHDLEDLISVVDGRATLSQEVQSRKFELRAYIGSEIHALMDMPGFLDALPAYLLPDTVSQSRITIILQRLERLATN